MNSNKNVEIALPIKINRLFTYSLPDDLEIDDVLYRRVWVNFRNRKMRGVVVGKAPLKEERISENEKNSYEIKPILKVIDKKAVINSDAIDLAKWIADYYFSSIGEVLSMMIPSGIRYPSSKKETLSKVDELTEKSKQNYEINNRKILTEEQREIYENINRDIENGKRKFYLYGVTGSGKTEVYIKLIEDTLKAGKGVIFLVPEITISYQTLLRLREVFGSTCAILHSGLSKSRRFSEYIDILNSKKRVVVGARNAIFAPVDNLGLIIIDEENESSYKSLENPRFHARSVAMQLSNKKDIPLVLGSATPSIESYYFAKSGFFSLYELKNRYNNVSLPNIEVVDSSSLSPFKNMTSEMVDEINRRLQKREQIVLFQNRRGFSTIIKCSDCGEIISCPNCSVSLIYHKNRDKFICHHCGFSSDFKNSCPKCGKNNLIMFGAGTQRIEDEIKKAFSFANIKRIDNDSIRDEDELYQIFSDIEGGKIDILVGTQIIAKGLDFPNIRFVGIINADLLLNIPDFKASERTFALVTQVAGRAGRAGGESSVMIQTINPEHYSIASAVKSSYEQFYNEEIQYRKVLKFPPFYRLLHIVVRGPLEEDVALDIEKIYSVLNENRDKNGFSDVELLPSAPSPISKLNNKYRYSILMKSKKIKSLQNLLKLSLENFKLNSKNRLEIDVDPQDLF